MRREITTQTVSSPLRICRVGGMCRGEQLKPHDLEPALLSVLARRVCLPAGSDDDHDDDDYHYYYDAVAAAATAAAD